MLGTYSNCEIYAKLLEVQHQVLFLTKLVQRGSQGGQSATQDGSYRIPENVFLPLNSVKAVSELEQRLADRDVRMQLV